jgi:hypothetical protein
MEVAPMILRAVELAGVLLMVGAESSAFANDPSFFGEWARGDGKAHIRIERCSGQGLRHKYLGQERCQRRKDRRSAYSEH